MCDEKTILGNNGRTLRVKTCQNCSFDIFQPDVPSIVFKFLEGDIIFHLPSLTCLYQPPCVGVGQYSYIFMCHDHTVILRPFWKDFSNKLFFAFRYYDAILVSFGTFKKFRVLLVLLVFLITFGYF